MMIVVNAGHTSTDCVTAFASGANLNEDKSATAPYLDGIVVGLASFRVGLVGHEPGLQQVLVKAVAKSSDRGVICGGEGRRALSGHSPKEKSSDGDVKNLIINCFPIFAAASRAVRNIRHQKSSWEVFLFDTTVYRRHISLSVRPFCLLSP